MSSVRDLVSSLGQMELELLGKEYDEWERLGSKEAAPNLFIRAKEFSGVHINHFMLLIAAEVYRELYNRENDLHIDTIRNYEYGGI